MLRGYFGFWFDADYREILLEKTQEIPTLEELLIAYSKKTSWQVIKPMLYF